MGNAEQQVVAQMGKFKTWRVELIDASTGNITGIRYEVRKEDEVVEQFDNEREAVEEMALQNRVEVQNRPSGPGM
jgi:hypothetical protein